MRLLSYINEKTEVTEEDAVDIIMRGFQAFAEKVNNIKHKHYLILLDILNDVFEPLGVGFKLTDSEVMAGGTDVETRKINLTITKRQLNSLKTNNGIEAYGNNILGLLLHELTHKKQIEKIPPNRREKIFKKELKTKASEIKYLSSKDEIEAYARQAAYEAYNLEKYDIYQMYKNITKDKYPRVWNRFLKKFYQYLPEDGE